MLDLFGDQIEEKVLLSERDKVKALYMHMLDDKDHATFKEQMELMTVAVGKMVKKFGEGKLVDDETEVNLNELLPQKMVPTYKNEIRIQEKESLQQPEVIKKVKQSSKNLSSQVSLEEVRESMVMNTFDDAIKEEVEHKAKRQLQLKSK